MNKIKIYMRTKGNIEEQSNEYAKVFNGQIIKKSVINRQDLTNKSLSKDQDTYTFAYLNILKNINILIAKNRPEHPTFGYSGDCVLSIDSNDVFLDVYNNMKSSSKFTLEYNIQEWGWGTKIVKFSDFWGFYWILETKI